MLRARKNIALMKAAAFFDWWPIGALMAIYFESITGSYAIAGLVFSVYMLTQAAAEIPVGVISDRWSRRKTLAVCGSFSISCALCLAMAGELESTALLFACAVFWGLSEALGSGTDEAFMYETMKDLKKTSKYDVVYSGVNAWGYAGAAVSNIAAVPIVYFWGIGALAWVSLVPACVQFIIFLLYAEPENYKPAGAESLSHIMAALGNFKSARILELSVAQSLNTSWNETQYRMNSLYFALFLPTFAINIVVFLYQTLMSAGFYAAMFLRKMGLLKMAFASGAFKSFAMAAGLVMNNIASPFVIVLSALGAGGEKSAESALLQRELSDEQRATMRSIVNIFAGISSAAAFWFFGAIADLYSVYAALVGLLIYKVAITLYYARLMRKYKDTI